VDHSAQSRRGLVACSSPPLRQCNVRSPNYRPVRCLRELPISDFAPDCPFPSVREERDWYTRGSRIHNQKKKRDFTEKKATAPAPSRAPNIPPLVAGRSSQRDSGTVPATRALVPAAYSLPSYRPQTIQSWTTD
jgi:hypothetical protein